MEWVSNNILWLFPLIQAFITGLFIHLGKIRLDNITVRNQIKLQEFSAEKQLEMQTKYILLESKNRNLLETYPKLFNSMHEAAGGMVIYFTTIVNKLDEMKNKKKKIDAVHYISLLENYFSMVFKDPYFGIQETQKLSNEIEQASILISSDIYQKCVKFKKDCLKLWDIVREEIIYGKIRSYKKKQLQDLVERANTIIQSLNKQKEEISEAINQELSGESKKEQPKKWKDFFKKAA